jgi:hypothetical protein
MPTGKNWLYFIYINLAFALYIAGIYYFNMLADIQKDWPQHRCNPLYMGFADDVESNFTYCVQNTMTSFMGFILEPLTYITSSLGMMSFGFMNDINNIRAMFNKVRTLFSSIIESVFGVFLNIIIEFQKIIIGIKDLMGKSIGILVTLIFTIDGSLKTMQSAWNGPTGQLVRALGSCFHPETKVKLKNGEMIYMKDLNLGDILSSGSIVRTILKIDNYKKTKLYEIELDNKENVYVTGSHYVLDNSVNNYIPVEQYKKSKLSNKTTDWFVCLVTSDNKICIENETFWDWEDDKFTIDYFNKYLSKINLNVN